MTAELIALGDSVAAVLIEESTSLSVHAFVDSRTSLDRTLWSRATELGWLAIGLPEARCGGLGLGAAGLEMLFGKLGASLAPGPFVSTLAAAQALAETAGSPQIDSWLQRVIAGECRIAIPAQLDGVGSADQRAALFLGDADATLFLAPRSLQQWALLRLPAGDVERVDMWDRTRSIVRVRLERAEEVVRIEDGQTLARRLKTYMALALAADSLGGSQSLLDQTIDYMKQRRQFDRPIASFQALKHRVADMKTLVVAGAPAIAQALSAMHDGFVDAEFWAFLAKAKLTEDFAFIAQDCLQLHGGVGFTWEFDVHLYLKRARLNEMLLAPGWILRDRAAAALARTATEQRTTLELPIT
jgi:alkylation response protein AidB-like acyl-CoA dehydrogenase